MKDSRFTRRDFVRTTGAAAAAGLAGPYLFTAASRAAESKNNRPLFGAIGVGGQGNFIADRASGKQLIDNKRPGGYADCVAVADVKQDHAEAFRKKYDGKPEIYGDYRKLLDRKDIECVTIATPDHWHVHVCLDALAAGKHIYCEKPLTLTIDEGHTLIKAVKESGKTVQVGTMQRTDRELLQFARAVATVRSGQLGKLRKVTVYLPPAQAGGPFATASAPATLNWDMWLGQAPEVDYCFQRAEPTFRWWYEYSGGVLTDWGAHHLDIVHWALNQENSGPLTIDGSATKLPHIPNGYNVPEMPVVDYVFAGDLPVHLESNRGRNGVLFDGENGRVFVDRGRITGKPIEEQDADKKLREKIDEETVKLFKDNADSMGDHMGNFFDAWMHGKQPVSDVVSQHRAVSSCHLGNISIRLGRKLTWDPAKEEFVGDEEANAMRSRPQRAPWRFG